MTRGADVPNGDAPVPVRNYRTRLEAELAALSLAGGEIPYLLQSSEGMLHGPLAPGATILVRSDDVARAIALLAPTTAPEDERTVYRWSLRTARDLRRATDRLAALEIPYLMTPVDGGSAVLYIRQEHAQRARRVLGRWDPAAS